MSYFLKPHLAATLPQTINGIYTTIDVAYDIDLPAPAPLDVVTDKCALPVEKISKKYISGRINRIH
jgi:hypothetical protein